MRRAVLILLLLAAACGNEFKARSFSMRADSELKKIPAYRELAKYEPATYEKIKTDIEAVLRNGGGQAEVAAKARAAIAGIIGKYVATASDEALLRYLRVTVSEIRQASEKDMDVAYAIMFPNAGGPPFELTKYVSSETMNEDLTALADVIRTGAQSQGSPLNQTRANELLVNLVQNELRPKFGDDLAILEKGGQPGTDKRKFVAVSLALYDAIFALPEGDGAQVLRMLMSAK